VVDAVGVWSPDDERSERTRRRIEDRTVIRDGFHGGLEPERSKRIAQSLQPNPNMHRRSQTGGSGKCSPEVFARLAKCLRAASGGDFIDEESDKIREPAVGEFDPFEFRFDAVDLGRASGTWSGPAAGPLVCNRKETGLRQPVQAATGDIAVHAEGICGVRSRKRAAASTRIQQKRPQMWITRRGKTFEHHCRTT
jgi:hypothetical protein